MPSIYLIRHAQASFGSEDYDVLSELGYRQAALLDAALTARGVRAARVIAGSLRRQADTARACPSCARTETVIDPRWNEYDSAEVMARHRPAAARGPIAGGIGAPAGMSSRDFQRVLDSALHRWVSAGERSPCQETWTAFQGRAVAALQQLAGELTSGEDALVFTSGGVMAAIAASLLEAPDKVFVALNRTTVNVGVTKVMVGRSGVRLLSYNEHAHVQGERGAMTFR